MKPSDRKLRVLVVDDSLFMRAAVAKLLTTDGRFEVVGQAKDGAEAVDRVMDLKPDVVTMDFNMPKMNGAESVRAIMGKRPTPVIMFSAHTKQGARETFEALAAGAVDFVTKPGGEVSADLRGIADDLTGKLLAASGARPRALAPIQQAKPKMPVHISTWPPTGPRVLVIGVLTGGPAALSRVIPTLPATIRFAIVIVQHMPASFTATLAERLNGLSAVSVREARHGDIPAAGMVFIAPGDRHLEVGDGGVLNLTDAAPVNGCRPSADVTMASAARVFGRRAIGLVMTGMGKDGAAGLAAIKQADGITLAQDQATSVIYGMPKAAIDAGVVDEVLSLDDIARRLQEALMARAADAVLAPVGFAARLVYFLLAPFVLIAAGRVFPVWGAALNLGLVLVVFFTASTLRRWADSSRVIRRLFGRQLALEEYYRERPPRPFLYYVLYPLLAPYWLIARSARREFTLFKGYSAVGLVLVVVLASVDYARNWAPDIAFGHFVGATIATVVVQFVLVLAILMPVATSIIAYGLSRQRARLAILFAAAVLSTALGVAAARAMQERIPMTVRSRIHFRTDAKKEEARAARLDAIRAAALAGRAGATRDNILEAARDALGSFYRPDEVRGFRLFANRWGGMIYCPATSRRPPIWVAMRTSGGLVEDEAELPPEARRLLAAP